MRLMNGYDNSFMIGTFKTRYDENGTLVESGIRQIYGSAFAISQSTFVTAAHVLQSLPTDQECFLIHAIQGGHFELGQIVDKEEIDQHDLGILTTNANFQNIVIPKWSSVDLHAGYDVFSTGYPHALEDDTHNTIRQRFFKGYISCNTAFKRFNTPFATFIYELSFFSPRGLSGSPLFFDNGEPVVVGLMVMNIEKQQEIFGDKYTEKTSDGTSEKIVEYVNVDRYRVGVAVQSKWILNVQSRICGGTIGDFLKQKNLVIDVPV